ncbi:MAG: pilin [Patescibacteria group bacterium]
MRKALVLSFFLFLFTTFIPQQIKGQTFRCVWDQFNTPKCQLRQIPNDCFADSDASKCNIITVDTACNSASFSCPATPGNCVNCSGIPLPSYPFVCPGVSSPNVCCKTQSACPTPNYPIPTPSGNGQALCPDGVSIDTAIGCIPVTDTNLFIGFILRWAIGIGGGIAFLLIVYAAFMIMSSRGNPDRLKAGQELLTSAIAGLIMLIFSVFILRVIGVDILQLPGLEAK